MLKILLEIVFLVNFVNGLPPLMDDFGNGLAGLGGRSGEGPGHGRLGIGPGSNEEEFGGRGGGRHNCDGDSGGAGNGRSAICVENGLVSGVQGTYYSNVTVFKGIPFAAPPVDQLRWKPPQPFGKWNGTLTADTFAADCAQSRGSISGAEDCLYLNIWIGGQQQKALGKKQPVYVWIYGGGYSAGSSSSTDYDGENLANKGLVVVTIAYRLGPFGFLALPALSAESGQNSSSNYGLLDQIAALKWVQRNIGAFGGDPQRVTIGGQSAGAGSCYILTNSPLAKGLFQGVIAESGALMSTRDPEISGLPASHYTMAEAEQLGIDYLASMNISAANTSLDALRAISMETMLQGSTDSTNALPFTMTTWNGEPPYFHPALDGYVLPRTYQETLANGLQNQIHLMAGHNHDEWGASPSLAYTVEEYESIVEAKYGNFSAQFLAIYPAGNSTTEASNQANNAIRDNTRVSQYLWAQEWLKNAKKPFYQYFWNHTPPGQESSGASHGSEIQYFFGNLHTAASTTNWTATDYQIAETISSYVANFVANFDPNGPGLPEWPQTRPAQPRVMQIGDNYTLIPIADPLETKMDFLTAFYASQPVW